MLENLRDVREAWLVYSVDILEVGELVLERADVGLDLCHFLIIVDGAEQVVLLGLLPLENLGGRPFDVRRLGNSVMEGAVPNWDEV